MILIPIVALLVGILLGRQVMEPVRGPEGAYLAVAVIAGIDTVFGGIRAALEDKFRTDVFVSGFITNMLIAFFLAWFGDQIGINLFLAAALVLGSRIYTNLSLIRRLLITRYQDARQRRKLEAEQQAAGPSSS